MNDEKETTLHRFTDEETKRLRFVQKACSKDQARPVLTGINIDENNAVAADGFRLHIVPTPESFLQEYPGEVNTIIKPVNNVGKTRMIPARPEYLEIEKIEGNFPRYMEIVPAKEPIFRYALNKQYLKDLAEMPGSNMIVFEFFSASAPCKIYNFTDDKGYRGEPGERSGNMAVIMPMYLPDGLRLDLEEDLKELEMMRKANSLRRPLNVAEK